MAAIGHRDHHGMRGSSVWHEKIGTASYFASGESLKVCSCSNKALSTCAHGLNQAS